MSIFAVRGSLGLGLLMAGAAFAADDPKLDNKVQRRVPTAFAGDKPRPVLDWGARDGKSYISSRPATSCFSIRCSTSTTGEPAAPTITIPRSPPPGANLTGKWAYDSDPFDINQFVHPYQGSIYHGFGGSFLGEPLFRMANLPLESGDGRPGFWRELGAAVLSPATDFNRLAFGSRFDGVFRSNDPAVYTRIAVGRIVSCNVSSSVNLNQNA